MMALSSGLRFPALLLPFLFFIGCLEKKGSSSNPKRTIRYREQMAEISLQPKRVLSLSPAVTEILFHVLPDSLIVGITPLCNFPKEKTQHKTRVEVYPLNIEKLLQLKPDIVFSEEGITSPQDAAHLRQLGIPVLLFHYEKSQDIIDAMDSVRAWVVPETSRDHISALQMELNEQEKKQATIPDGQRPGVLCITWMDPIFAYGFETWMTDKIRLAGGKNVLSEKLDKPYPTLQRETILKLNPDVLFGGSFEKMDSTFFELYPELKKTRAYQNRMVFELNDDLASRPAPRFMQGIQEIENRVNATKALLITK
jgi:iron complex transport system substrate-binding protein